MQSPPPPRSQREHGGSHADDIRRARPFHQEHGRQEGCCSDVQQRDEGVITPDRDDGRSQAGDGESRSVRSRRHGKASFSAGSSRRGRGPEQMSEHDRSRTRDVSGQGSAGSFVNGSDVSDTKPLVRNRGSSHGSAATRSLQTPPKQSLLRHMFRFGRLALQAQHPDFSKESPRTIKVLREAAGISRPLLKMVKDDLKSKEGDGRRKGRVGFDAKGNLMKEGVKWVERQVEGAERDLRRLERRQEREGMGKGKGKRRHGKKKHRKEGREMEGDWSAYGCGKSARSSDDGHAGEDYVYGGLPAPETAAECEDSLEEYRDSARASAAGHTQNASHTDRPGQNEWESRGQGGHSRSSRPDSQRLATLSHRDRSGHDIASQHHPRPYVESYHSSVRSNRHGPQSDQHAQMHTPSLRSSRPSTTHSRLDDKDHRASTSHSRNSRQTNAARSSHEQRSRQEAPFEAGNGAGLAAEYYKSFGLFDCGGHAASHHGPRLRSTLRPEDSFGLRSSRPHDSATTREELDNLKNWVRGQGSGEMGAVDPGSRVSRLSYGRAATHDSKNAHPDRRGHGHRRAGSNIPPPPIGPGRILDGDDDYDGA